MAEFKRPPKELVDKLAAIGSATASGELKKLGIRSPHMIGPVARTPGKAIAGPAMTLQFMPKREDLYPDGEYVEPDKQVHRWALIESEPGDVVVVDARGSMTSGVFGEMMLTYFKGKGGAGIVVDGAIRDFPEAQKLDLPMWLRGTTPNFHTQTDIFPMAHSVPIACGGVLVMPGDIIVADDDGAVVVPQGLAEELSHVASEHAEWEVFSRMKLEQGGDLRKYYPLSDEARVEYEEWKKTNG